MLIYDSGETGGVRVRILARRYRDGGCKIARKTYFDGALKFTNVTVLEVNEAWAVLDWMQENP